MTDLPSPLVSLELEPPIWDRFFTVAPLVVVGTRNADGSYDLYTTHRGYPLGPTNLFAFLGPPDATATANAVRERAFAVSFLSPQQVVEASIAAAGTDEGGSHPLLAEIPTFPAQRIDARLLTNARVFLECRLERIVEDLGGSMLVVGSIVAAHVDHESRRMSDRDDYDLLRHNPLLAFVAPGRVAAIEQTDAFPEVE